MGTAISSGNERADLAGALWHKVTAITSHWAGKMPGSSLGFVLLLCLLATTTQAREEQDIAPNVTTVACTNAISQGFACTEYQTTTLDGFVLTLSRVSVPGKPISKRPVLCQHGLVDTSATWTTGTRNQSLAYVLADAGFDVWLGNNRGREPYMHVNLTITDPRYWAWSWDELGEHDLDVTLRKVLAECGSDSKIGYIGHSQGTLEGFTHFNGEYDLSARIVAFVGYGPVAFARHGHATWLDYLNGLFQHFCGGRHSPTCDVSVFEDFRAIATSTCQVAPKLDFCIGILCGLAGCESHANYDQEQFATKVLTNYPSSTSSQNIAHFTQMTLMQNDTVMKFDYGSAQENMNHYGQTSPPVYNISAVSVPMHLFYGTNDKFADPVDAQNLFKLLPANLLHIYPTEYGHGDFLWGLDAAIKVYQPTVSILQAAFDASEM